MKLKYTKPTPKGFTLVELLVVMAIIAVLASIATPLVLQKRKEADRTKAIAHAKQSHIGIISFEGEEGVRPGAQIVAEGNVTGAAATTSNDVLRQLLQRLPDVRTEAIFFAPSKISLQPDNDIGDAANNYAQAMEQGECGYLYVDNPASRSGAPLMAAPLIDGTSAKFDYDAYIGKAVVLKTDGAAVSVDIDEDAETAMIKVGGSLVDMFTTANKTFRNAPSILYPIPR